MLSAIKKIEAITMAACKLFETTRILCLSAISAKAEAKGPTTSEGRAYANHKNEVATVEPVVSNIFKIKRKFMV